MTMNYYHAAIDSQSRQQRIQQEAEKRRLLQANTNTEMQAPTETHQVFAPLLAKTGEVLVSVGQHLQERYSQNNNTPQAASQSPA